MADNKIDAVKNGDVTAFEELLESYEPLILSETSKVLDKFSGFSGETEELIQEGRLAFYDAAMTYKENAEVTFGLYAKICVHNRMISYVRKLTARKRREARLSLLEGRAQSGDREEGLLSAYERSGEVRKFISCEASELENKVFMLYLQRKSYAEIALELGVSAKSVDNALSRVKKKLKKRFGK